MIIRSICSAAIIFIAMPAQAQVDCAVVNSLTRITTTTTTHTSWGNDDLPPGNVRTDISHFDRTSIQHLFSDVPDEDGLRTLDQFAQVTALIAQYAQNGQGAEIHILLQAPSVISLFDDARKVLDSIGCHGPSVTDDAMPKNVADALEKAGEAKNEARSATTGSGIDFGANLLVWGLVGLAVAATIGLFVFLRKRGEKLRRRQRRYTLNLPIKFAFETFDAQGRALDISCNGLKIRHYGQLPSEPSGRIKVELAGHWYETKCQWHNEHYAGLSFATTLRVATVLQILSGVKGRGANAGKTKTAPEGAPQSKPIRF